MKIYVTKYALTQGIFTQEADKVTASGMAQVPPKRGASVNMAELYHRGEWFRTFPEAVADVRKKIAKKRVSIAKQLAKLDAMEKFFSSSKKGGS